MAIERERRGKKREGEVIGRGRKGRLDRGETKGKGIEEGEKSERERMAI